MTQAATRRAVVRAAALAGLGLLAACASQVAKVSRDQRPEWVGRFSLSIHSDPAENWSASFELQGSASVGELRIQSPLGQQLASLRWTDQGAELQQGDRVIQRPSLDALSSELAHGAVPVTALFDWLQGRPSKVTGWEADLSRQPEGRIVARRLQPLPTAELKLVFEP